LIEGFYPLIFILGYSLFCRESQPKLIKEELPIYLNLRNITYFYINGTFHLTLFKSSINLLT